MSQTLRISYNESKNKQKTTHRVYQCRHPASPFIPLFQPLKNSFRSRQSIRIRLQAHDQSPKFKGESETPHSLTKENTTSASPASLSSTSKSSYDPTTGRTPNPLSFSPFSAVRTRAEIWKEPEVKEGWMRSRERTEPPMYPTQNRLFQDWSRFFF